MHICLVIDAKLPIGLYGGTERVAFSLGRSLFEMGHRITYLAQPSLIPFANTIVFDKTRSIESQIPKDVDLVHLHSDFPILKNIPSCKTIHGNTREEKNFHPNSIFVSKSHAQNHNAKVFVYNGIDERDYGSVNFSSDRNAFVFLGNASWRVKNIKGSIQVAKLANSKINILKILILINYTLMTLIRVLSDARIGSPYNDQSTLKMNYPFNRQRKNHPEEWF
jgi:hypothetical protein